MRPCDEYEAGEYEKVEQWFKIGDSMDEETGEWCLEIEEKLGTSEVQPASKVLQHTGLRDWIAAPKQGEDRRSACFKCDAVAKVGEEKSWTCEETGQVVWI